MTVALVIVVVIPVGGGRIQELHCYQFLCTMMYVYIITIRRLYIIYIESRLFFSVSL